MIWFIGAYATLVSILFGISLFYNYKFGRILIRMEDALETSLDRLDERYRSIASILEIDLFYDSPQIRQVVGWLRVKFGYVANLIREGIRTLLKALGLDPTGETSALVSYLKKIAAFVKRVTEILAEVIEWRNIILEVARIAKAIIDWILNLPARLAKLLNECLSNLYAAIAGGFKEILSIALGGGTGADKEIGKAVNEITSASNILIRQVSDLATTPQQIQAALTNPSDPRTLAAIDNYVTAQLANTSSYTTNTGSNRENLSGVV